WVLCCWGVCGGSVDSFSGAQSLARFLGRLPRRFFVGGLAGASVLPSAGLLPDGRHPRFRRAASGCGSVVSFAARGSWRAAGGSVSGYDELLAGAEQLCGGDLLPGFLVPVF